MSDPESVLIADPQEVLERIAEVPGVAAVTPRLSFSALGSTGKATVNVSVVGVDPAGEADFSEFETLLAGNPLEPGEPEVGLIGEELRRGLGAEIGDWVTVLTTSFDGVINAVDFRVAGVVRTGSREYDSVFVKVPIGVAQRAKETGDVERIVVLLDDTDDLPAVQPRVTEILSTLDREFEVRRWDELAGFYDAVVSLYTGLFTVFAAIVGVVVMFSVANTMTMAVFERTGEIGALRAIGARRSILIAMFLAEGAGVGLLGAGLGVAASWLIAGAVEMAGGIPMPPPPGMSQGFQAYLKLTGEVLRNAFAVTVAATLISSVYPAFAASRIRIVEALQQ